MKYWKCIVFVAHSVVCSGQWTLKTYVDEFGDKTDAKYITQSMFGSFDNSATRNSELGVNVIISKDYEVRFDLHEYNLSRSVGEIIGPNGGYNLTLKLSDESILKYELLATANALYINSFALIELLKSQSNKIKCLIEIDGTYSSLSSYRFQINPIGFTKAYAKLENK